VHLLMALVDKPKLARCDGLWPLLTLGQSQLELRPLLDAQSDERPEMQQEAELAQGGEVEFVGVRSVLIKGGTEPGAAERPG
jgi:type VI secretion system protein VasG